MLGAPGAFVSDHDSKGEHSQGGDASLAAFLSQVQGKRKALVFNQIEV